MRQALAKSRYPLGGYDLPRHPDNGPLRRGLGFKVSALEYVAIMRAASHAGLTMTEFVRSHALLAARVELEMSINGG